MIRPPGSRPFLARVVLALGSIGLLLGAAGLPIWQAKFSAPQYPQGLNISAYGSTVKGDLSEINELSHYIGMPPFNFVGMPEMRLWPLVILVAMLACALAALTRRRWLRRLATLTVWMTPIGALADVQFRLWQVGHGLDPTSPIRVSPFAPRVVGPTTLMNFTIDALPGMSLVLIALAAALVTWAPSVTRRLTRGKDSGTEAKVADTGLTDTDLTDDTDFTDTELTDSALTDSGLTNPAVKVP